MDGASFIYIKGGNKQKLISLDMSFNMDSHMQQDLQLEESKPFRQNFRIFWWMIEILSRGCNGRDEDSFIYIRGDNKQK